MKLHTQLFASVAFTFPQAFNNKTAWKLDADGHIEMKDGNPVYVDSNGNDMVVESNTITRLNSEARQHRVDKEEAQRKLKDFEGLDPAAARTALETVSKIDQKKLIDAGEVDRVRKEIGDSFQTQINELTEKNTKLTQQRDSTILENAFGTSEFIRDKIAVPPDMFRSTFKDNFKIEDGQIVPYDSTGSKLYSKKRAGEVADFGEAVELLVDQYPHKDRILKADEQSGTGSGGNGGNRGGGRVIRRADFDKMTPVEKHGAAQLMQKGEARIVD